MKIEIFQNEIKDGLQDAITSGNTVAYVSTALPHVPQETEEEKAKLFALNNAKGTNLEQFDLYYLKSVLVSTGWNNNDDVFDIGETWAARNTPEDKQFNFMHDETDIIGHITDNYVLNKNGKVVSDEQLDISEDFDIITTAVLYNSWGSLELQERMNSLIADIKDGKWFVSMECLFAGFDYAAISPDGEHKVIARDESSAFLTKHLRSYGGEGEFEGYKLGRLLRNISFSGKGLVNNPANPRSVIFNGTSPFTSALACSITESGLTMENENMASEDVLQKQLDELKAELADAKNRESALEKQLIEVDSKAILEQVETLTQTVSERDGAIQTLEATIENLCAEKTELTETLEKKTEEATAFQSELDELQAQIHTSKRLSALKDAGLQDEEAAATLEKFADANDEMFDEIVNLLAFNGKYKKNDEDDEEDEEKDADASITDEVAEEDEAEANADAETLESVEEETDISLADAGDTVGINEVRASASAWLQEHVLKTTANQK